MSAYTPHSLTIVGMLLALLAATLLAAFAVSRIRQVKIARVLAWIAVTAAAATAERLTAQDPVGVRMLAICAVTLIGMKGVVTVEYQALGGRALPMRNWLLFAAWPGMKPELFETLGEPVAGAGALLKSGLIRLALGGVCFGLARAAWLATSSRVLATARALPAISLVLHFGLFNIGAGVFRLLGAPCTPLFDAPLASTSLTEFWGRRWNLAFTEMCKLAVYRPLLPHVNRGTATAAAFLLSALLHELAISVPARAGYGLPLAYFALHGVLTVGEKRLAKRGTAIDARSRLLGRVWTVGWLVQPFQGHFPRDFDNNCAVDTWGLSTC